MKVWNVLKVWKWLSDWFELCTPASVLNQSIESPPEGGPRLLKSHKRAKCGVGGPFLLDSLSSLYFWRKVIWRSPLQKSLPKCQTALGGFNCPGPAIATSLGFVFFRFSLFLGGVAKILKRQGGLQYIPDSGLLRFLPLLTSLLGYLAHSCSTKPKILPDASSAITEWKWMVGRKKPFPTALEPKKCEHPFFQRCALCIPICLMMWFAWWCQKQAWWEWAGRDRPQSSTAALQGYSYSIRLQS